MANVKLIPNLQKAAATIKKKKKKSSDIEIRHRNSANNATKTKKTSESSPSTQKQVPSKLKNNATKKATTNRLVPNIPTYNSSKNKKTQGVYKKFYSDVVPKVGASVVNTEQKTTKMANAAAKKQEEFAQKIKEKTKNDSALGASYLQGLRNPIRTLYNLGKIHDDTADVTNYQAMFQRGSAHITPAMAEKMRSQGQRGREKFFSADQKRDEKIQKSIDDGNVNSFLSDLARAAGGLTSDLPAMLAGGGVSSVVKGGTTAAKVINSLANAATSPATSHYTLQNMGNRYTEALKEGATRDEALNSALMYAYPLAVSERLGGADTAITKALSGKLGGSVLSNVIKSAGSEAIEEAAQTPFESATKMNYKDVPLFSVDKEQDAILNPSQMAYNASIGGILGGVAGGGISVANNAINNTEQTAIENSAKTDELSEQMQSKVSNIVQNDTLNSEIANNSNIANNSKVITDKAKSGIKPTTAEVKSLSPTAEHTAARTEFETETGVTLPNSEKGTKKAVNAYAERKANTISYAETQNDTDMTYAETQNNTDMTLNSAISPQNQVDISQQYANGSKKHSDGNIFKIDGLTDESNNSINNTLNKAFDEILTTGYLSIETSNKLSAIKDVDIDPKNATSDNLMVDKLNAVYERVFRDGFGMEIPVNVDMKTQVNDFLENSFLIPVEQPSANISNTDTKKIVPKNLKKENVPNNDKNTKQKTAEYYNKKIKYIKKKGVKSKKEALENQKLKSKKSKRNAIEAQKQKDEKAANRQVEKETKKISDRTERFVRAEDKLANDIDRKRTESQHKQEVKSVKRSLNEDKRNALNEQRSKIKEYDNARLAVEKDKGKLRIKNLKEFHRAKDKAKLNAKKEREIRLKLSSTIQRLLKSNTSKQIKDRIRKTFSDVNLNSLVARNTENNMINIGKMDISHVETLQSILESINSYLSSSKNEQGIAQKRIAYEKMLIDADIILDMYRKEPVLVMDSEGMISRKDSRPSVFGLEENDFDNIPKVNIDHIIEKMSVKDRVVATIRNLIRSWVDAGEAVMRLSKTVGDKSLYNYYDSTKRATEMANFGVSNYIQDIKTGEKVCDSLFSILDPVIKKGDKYYKDFQEYLLHINNIDRYNQGVGIWGETFTAEESKKIAEKLADENPEFEAQAEKVYEFYRALMKMRVDGGIVTEEFADMLNKMYPNYVSTYRDTKKKPSSDGIFGNIASVRSGVKRAKGDDVLAILPLHEQMETALRNTIKQAKTNMFFTRLTNDLIDEKNTVHGVDVLEITDDMNPVDFLEANVNLYNEDVKENSNDKTYTYSFFHNGKQYNVECERDIALAIKDLMRQPYQDSPILKVEGSIVGVWKELITTFNPKFIAANAARDIQDAAIYTKGLRKFFVKYPKAVKDIMTGSEDFQRYQASGGFSSSYFSRDESNTQISKRHNIIRRNTLDRVYHLNYLIEQLPRYTEYLATLDRLHKDNPKGLTEEEILQEALHNSADVTVNFKRRGSWGRFVNNHVTPFFNPAIQGTSKSIRIFMDEEATSKTKAAAAASEVFIISRTIVKLSLAGIIPSALNYFLLGDDDDYENKSDLEKARYYFFPTDNGFIKIPKGRLNAFVSGMGIAFYNGMTEDDWSGFELDKISELLSYSVGAINPITENVLSVPTALRYNTNWLGNPIDSKWEKGNPNNYKNYDEYSTTYAIWLAEKFKDSCISPKQIDYVIDQISGVVGDMISPAFTVAYSSEKDSIPKRFGGTMERYLKKMFYEDNEKNDIANQFYEAKNTVRYSMDSKDSEDYLNVVNKMYNWRGDVVSYYNDEITSILNNNKLTGDEKQKRIKAWKKKKNDFMEKTLDKQKTYEEAAKKYYGKYGNIEEAYLYANQKVFGSKYAIYCEGKTVREKADEIRGVASLSYDDYFDIYSSFVRIKKENKTALDNEEITDSDIKSYKVKFLLSNKNLSDKQKLIVANEYSLISDVAYEKAKELKSSNDISYSDFLDIYNNLLKIGRTYSDVDAGNQTKIAAQRAFIMGYSGLTNEQKTQFDDKFINDVIVIPKDDLYDYEGAESVGFTDEAFKTATVTLSNIKADYDENGDVDKTSKKKKIIAAIDDMNITTEQKNYLYAANYSTKKGYPNWGNTGYSYDSSEIKFTGDETDTTQPKETTMTRDQLNNLKKAAKIGANAVFSTAMSVAGLNPLTPNQLTQKRGNTTSAPVDLSTINTGYPFGTPDSGKASGKHMGTDFKVASGTPVTSTSSGTVIEAGNTGGAYGNRVVVDMGNGYYCAFNHLSDWGVKKGDKVTAGQVIAKSGNTGNSRGAHLEIEVYKGSPKYGNQVDPVSYFGWNGSNTTNNTTDLLSQAIEKSFGNKVASSESGGSGSYSSGSGSSSSGSGSGGSSGKNNKRVVPNFNFNPTLKSISSGSLPNFEITPQYQERNENSSEAILAKYLELVEKLKKK